MMKQSNNILLLMGRLHSPITAVGKGKNKMAKFELEVLDDIDDPNSNKSIFTVTTVFPHKDIMNVIKIGNMMGIKGMLAVKDNFIYIIANKISFLSSKKEKENE